MSTLVERLRAASAGKDEWRVQDPKDGGYCVAFARPEAFYPEREARAWLEQQKLRYPGSDQASFVVACVRVTTEDDDLRNEAADEIERLTELLAKATAAFEREQSRADAAEVCAETAQAEANAADAARWRYARDLLSVEDVQRLVEEYKQWDWCDTDPAESAKTDAAIDAAMAAQPAQEPKR